MVSRGLWLPEPTENPQEAVSPCPRGPGKRMKPLIIPDLLGLTHPDPASGPLCFKDSGEPVLAQVVILAQGSCGVVVDGAGPSLTRPRTLPCARGRRVCGVAAPLLRCGSQAQSYLRLHLWGSDHLSRWYSCLMCGINI